MGILVSGSMAFDTIISTVGTFKSQIIPEALDSFNMSLFSPVLRREYGGTAGNIAYNLALLGKNPEIITTVGEDAHAYIERLTTLGVRTESVRIITGELSPQWYMIADEIGRQITAFHPGALSFSGELSIRDASYRFAIISPDSRDGMLSRMRECEERGIFRIFDPGQAMGLFSAAELLDMAMRADLVIMNEYESEMFATTTGKTLQEVVGVTGKTAIITLGEKGSRIISSDGEVFIPVIRAASAVDPTGCGDAFRGGLLYGLSEGWDLEKSCRLGSILGSIKIASTGGQNHRFTRDEISAIGEREFGEKFFA